MALACALCFVVLDFCHMDRTDTSALADAMHSARLAELRRIQAELMERRRRIREQIKNETRKRKRLQAKAARLTRNELLAIAANAQ